MRVYIDCLELRSLNRRKKDENHKKKRKRNFLVFYFILKIKLNTYIYIDI